MSEDRSARTGLPLRSGLFNIEVSQRIRVEHFLIGLARVV
jgi:hypothetical protein